MDVYITSMRWNRIYLNIDILSCFENIKCFIKNDKSEKYYLNTEKTADNRITMSFNITNAGDGTMLNAGSWRFYYETENSSENILEVDITLAKKLEDYERVFPYAEGNYAYVVTFQPVVDQHFISFNMSTEYMMKNRNPQKIVSSGRKSSRASEWMEIGAKKIMIALYRMASWLFPKKGNRILFMSQSANKISGNLKALDDYIKSQNELSNFKTAYYFQNIYEKQSAVFKTFGFLRLIFLAAKSDFIFVDNYVPLLSVIDLTEKTKVIQLWHAGIGFKNLGYSRFGQPGSPHPIHSAHRKYDYVIVDNANLIQTYSEVFGIEKNRILPFGMPRLDGYLNPQKIKAFQQDFLNQYPDLEGKRILLFAPTFRGTGQKDAYYDYDKIDMERLYDFCGTEYAVLFKMHPFVKSGMNISEKYRDRFYDFSDYPDINELFYITDILITDYSSAVYEFSLMHKPVIFYAYDQNRYELIRGIHRGFDAINGTVCHTFEQVIIALQKCADNVITLRSNLDTEKGISNACERIVQEILINKKR